MFKTRFKRFRFVALFAIFAVLVLLIVAGKTLQLNSIIQHKARAKLPVNFDFSVAAKKNNTFIGFLQETIQQAKHSSQTTRFKPALERPKSYKPDGLGEFGVKVVLSNLNNADKIESSRLMDEYGINHFLSNKISLHRTLNDPRPPM